MSYACSGKTYSAFFENTGDCESEIFVDDISFTEEVFPSVADES